MARGAPASQTPGSSWQWHSRLDYVHFHLLTVPASHPNIPWMRAAPVLSGVQTLLKYFPFAPIPCLCSKSGKTTVFPILQVSKPRQRQCCAPCVGGRAGWQLSALFPQHPSLRLAAVGCSAHWATNRVIRGLWGTWVQIT